MERSRHIANGVAEIAIAIGSLHLQDHARASMLSVTRVTSNPRPCRLTILHVLACKEKPRILSPTASSQRSVVFHRFVLVQEVLDEC